MNNDDLMKLLAKVSTNHKQKQTILILLGLLLITGSVALVLFNKKNNLAAENLSLQIEKDNLESKINEIEKNIETLSTENGHLYFLLRRNATEKNVKIEPEIPETNV